MVMKQFNIAVIPGDGVGAEVIDAALMSIEEINRRFSFKMTYTELLLGGRAIDSTGLAMPEKTLDECRKADAVLLGAVGGPKWDGMQIRPEMGVQALRAGLGINTYILSAQVYPELADASPLKNEKGIDFLIISELAGGIHFGRKGRMPYAGGLSVFDTITDTTSNIEHIGRVAFNAAGKRGKKLTGVDRANIFESSRVWREVMHRLALEYPDVQYEDMLADRAVFEMVRNPQLFDVVVSDSLFGEALSSEAAALTGLVGMLPSACLGTARCPGVFGPVHGPMTKIAGTDTANPIAAILSAAMMFRYGLNEPLAADAIESAVRRALQSGVRTADMPGGGNGTSTRGVGMLIAHEIAR